MRPITGKIENWKRKIIRLLEIVELRQITGGRLVILHGPLFKDISELEP